MNNVFVFLFCISLLCIPIFIVWAIINLIQKKMAKKRFVWAGISALVLIISIIGFGVTTTKVEAIELSIPNYQAEYDINTEIPVSISVTPENADASSLEYITDSGTLSFSSAGVLTGSGEGSFAIYVKSGDTISNIVEINVIDITAREEARALELAKAEEEQRAAEEQAAKEAEQKRLEQEQAAKEAEQKKLEAEKAAEEAEQKRLEAEKAAEEAEQKRLAEEQAAKEAEQQRLAQEQAAKEAEQQSAQAPVAPEPAAQSTSNSTGNGSNFNTYDNEDQQKTSASYVLNTSTHKIHYPSCSSVKKIAPQNYSTSSSSVEELINQGYTTCGNCF